MVMAATRERRTATLTTIVPTRGRIWVCSPLFSIFLKSAYTVTSGRCTVQREEKGRISVLINGKKNKNFHEYSQ